MMLQTLVPCSTSFLARRVVLCLRRDSTRWNRKLSTRHSLHDRNLFSGQSKAYRPETCLDKQDAPLGGGRPL